MAKNNAFFSPQCFLQRPYVRNPIQSGYLGFSGEWFSFFTLVFDFNNTL
jgi:hypothetical protein